LAIFTTARITKMNAKLASLALIAAAALIYSTSARASGFSPIGNPPAQQPAAQTPLAKPVGTVKAISGSTLTLATDSGAEVNVVVQDSTRIVRTTPGQKDLSKATLVQPKDVEVGDRVLARGIPSDDGKAVVAAAMILMKKSDVEAMKQREREDWTKRGVGGIVSAVDPANATLTISVSSLGGSKTLAIHTSKDTIVRRYAPDSVKFDDAKISTLDQIKPGDQVRARGTRNAEGTELSAEEIVSGTFLNIDGQILSVDATAGTVTVTDLISKSPVVVKVSSDSQVRQIPPMMAQMIAMRFKGGAAAPQSAAPGAGQRAAGAGASQPAGASGPGAASGGAPPGAGPGGSAGPGGRGDFQQILSRLPAASLSDLKKGDVVMIVSTQKDPSGKVTAITMLSGVDAILAASPAASQAMLMAPWNLSAPSGDAMSQ
jgi:exosome complex RNA-binding protein Csl4